MASGLEVQIFAFLILVGVSSAGCIAPESLGDDPEYGYRIYGGFNKNTNFDEMQDLGGVAEKKGGLMIILESDPAFFEIMGIPNKFDCDEVREYALAADYVNGATVCRWWDEDGYRD